MKEKIKEIGRPFKGHILLTVIWWILTLALADVLFYLPVYAGGLLTELIQSESLTKTMAMVAIVWMLAVMVVSMIYGVFGLHVKLSLFGSASNTAGFGALGLMNILEGGAAGILLIVPSLIFFFIKLLYAGFIGYICLMAALTSFVMRHTIPVLRNA